jgi:hypothetical protein
MHAWLNYLFSFFEMLKFKSKQKWLNLITSNCKNEYIRSLRRSVWLTEQFPLKTKDLLPLFDIMAKKVKAVRTMREYGLSFGL